MARGPAARPYYAARRCTQALIPNNFKQIETTAIIRKKYLSNMTFSHHREDSSCHSGPLLSFPCWAVRLLQ